MSEKNNPEAAVLYYRLEGVMVSSFSYRFPAKAPDLNFELNYNIAPQFVANPDEERLMVKLNIAANIIDDESDVVLFRNSTVFRVQDLKDHVEKNETGIFILGDKYYKHLTAFLGIALSTARGILIEKLNGTIYSGKYLPVLNPTEFLKPNQEG